jgi:hypothetical protein
VTRTLARPKKTQADHRIRSAGDRQKFHHSRHSFGLETSDHSQFLSRRKRSAGAPSAVCLRAGNPPGLPRGCSAAGDRLGVLPGGAPALLGAFSGKWARGRGGVSALRIPALPPITPALPPITTHCHALPRITTHFTHPLPPITKKASITELSRTPRGCAVLWAVCCVVLRAACALWAYSAYCVLRRICSM